MKISIKFYLYPAEQFWMEAGENALSPAVCQRIVLRDQNWHLLVS